MGDIIKFLELRSQGHTKTPQFGKSQKGVYQFLERKATKYLINKTCEFSGEPRATFLVDFSPNKRLVASTHGDHTVRVTDIQTGKCTHVLTGHPRTPWCLAFNPVSNDILASGCLGGEVHIWDLRGGGSEVLRNPNEGQVITSLAFNPAGDAVVFATLNKIYFWAWTRSKPFAVTETRYEFERVRWLRFDPCGRYLYTGIANNPTGQRTSVGDGGLDPPPRRETDSDQVGPINRARYQVLHRFMEMQQEARGNQARLRLPLASGPGPGPGPSQPSQGAARAESPVVEERIRMARQFAHHVTAMASGPSSVQANPVTLRGHYSSSSSSQVHPTPSHGSVSSYLGLRRAPSTSRESTRHAPSTPASASNPATSPGSSQDRRGRWGRYRPSFFSLSSEDRTSGYRNGSNSYSDEDPDSDLSDDAGTSGMGGRRSGGNADPIFPQHFRHRRLFSREPAGEGASATSHPFTRPSVRSEVSVRDGLESDEFEILPVDQERDLALASDGSSRPGASAAQALDSPTEERNISYRWDQLRSLWVRCYTSTPPRGRDDSNDAEQIAPERIPEPVASADHQRPLLHVDHRSELLTLRNNPGQMTLVNHPASHAPNTTGSTALGEDQLPLQHGSHDQEPTGLQDTSLPLSHGWNDREADASAGNPHPLANDRNAPETISPPDNTSPVSHNPGETEDSLTLIHGSHYPENVHSRTRAESPVSRREPLPPRSLNDQVEMPNSDPFMGYQGAKVYRLTAKDGLLSISKALEGSSDIHKEECTGEERNRVIGHSIKIAEQVKNAERCKNASKGRGKGSCATTQALGLVPGTSGQTARTGKAKTSGTGSQGQTSGTECQGQTSRTGGKGQTSGTGGKGRTSRTRGKGQTSGTECEGQISGTGQAQTSGIGSQGQTSGAVCPDQHHGEASTAESLKGVDSSGKRSSSSLPQSVDSTPSAEREQGERAVKSKNFSGGEETEEPQVNSFVPQNRNQQKVDCTGFEEQVKPYPCKGEKTKESTEPPHGETQNLPESNTAPLSDTQDLSEFDTAPLGDTQDLSESDTAPLGDTQDLSEPEAAPQGDTQDLPESDTAPQGDTQDLSEPEAAGLTDHAKASTSQQDGSLAPHYQCESLSSQPVPRGKVSLKRKLVVDSPLSPNDAAPAKQACNMAESGIEGPKTTKGMNTLRGSTTGCSSTCREGKVTHVSSAPSLESTTSNAQASQDQMANFSSGASHSALRTRNCPQLTDLSHQPITSSPESAVSHACSAASMSTLKPVPVSIQAVTTSSPNSATTSRSSTLFPVPVMALTNRADSSAATSSSSLSTPIPTPIPVAVLTSTAGSSAATITSGTSTPMPIPMLSSSGTDNIVALRERIASRNESLTLTLRNIRQCLNRLFLTTQPSISQATQPSTSQTSAFSIVSTSSRAASQTTSSTSCSTPRVATSSSLPTPIIGSLRCVDPGSTSSQRGPLSPRISTAASVDSDSEEETSQAASSSEVGTPQTAPSSSASGGPQPGRRQSRCSGQPRAPSASSRTRQARRLQQAVQQYRRNEQALRGVGRDVAQRSRSLERRVSELDRRISQIEQSYSRRMRNLQRGWDYMHYRIQRARLRMGLPLPPLDLDDPDSDMDMHSSEMDSPPYPPPQPIALAVNARDLGGAGPSTSYQQRSPRVSQQSSASGRPPRDESIPPQLFRRLIDYGDDSPSGSEDDLEHMDQPRQMPLLGRFRQEEAEEYSRRSHELPVENIHPDYESLDRGRHEDSLHFIMNNTIAGAFMSRDQNALASNFMPLTHRIQRWSVIDNMVPDIRDSSHDVVVRYCKLHNDASCCLSQDGKFLATFVSTHSGFPDKMVLAVFSLEEKTFGACMYTKSFGPNAISLSISPKNSYVVVGLAAKRLFFFSANQMVGQVYKLVKEKAGEKSMKHSQDLYFPENRNSHCSVNSARWLPGLGMGLVFGTNKGDLVFSRPGPKNSTERKASQVPISRRLARINDMFRDPAPEPIVPRNTYRDIIARNRSYSNNNAGNSSNNSASSSGSRYAAGASNSSRYTAGTGSSSSRYTAGASSSRYAADAGSSSRYIADAGSSSRYRDAGSSSRYAADAGSSSRYTDAGSSSRYTDAGSSSRFTDAGTSSRYAADAGSSSRYTADEASSRYTADEASSRYTADEASSSRFTADEASSSRYAASASTSRRRSSLRSSGTQTVFPSVHRSAATQTREEEGDRPGSHLQQ